MVTQLRDDGSANMSWETRPAPKNRLPPASLWYPRQFVRDPSPGATACELGEVLGIVQSDTVTKTRPRFPILVPSSPRFTSLSRPNEHLITLWTPKTSGSLICACALRRWRSLPPNHASLNRPPSGPCSSGSRRYHGAYPIGEPCFGHCRNTGRSRCSRGSSWVFRSCV